MNDNSAGALDAWRLWSPGLDDDDRTLGEVYASLPGVPAEKIHFLVRLIENPGSPVAFSGATTLLRHDCLHIVLGRGLLNQDEAFVIGYTMGASRGLRTAEVWAFKQIARHLYPGVYRMTADDLRVYDLGLAFGRGQGVRDVHTVPFEHAMERRIGDLRRSLGLSAEALRAAYRGEQAAVPGTIASRRLPVRPPPHSGGGTPRLAA